MLFSIEKFTLNNMFVLLISAFSEVNAGGSNYKYSIRGLGNEYDRGTVKTNKPTLDSNRTGSTLGARISAWGIITIIMLVIFSGVAAYYIFYCYPFIFSKDRKYNMMNNSSSATVTPTHSRDFQYESTSSKSSRVDI